jgi:tripeptide aminopeptidase
VGIEPFSPPTRGGTDGSRLTEQGIPTPNVFTGMQDFHGPHEWVSIQDMTCAAVMCVALAQLWSNEHTAAPHGEHVGESAMPASSDAITDWVG